MSKVTIAIPTFNRPEFLPLAIQSVLNQTMQDFKIIIFDSGSDYDIESLLLNFNDSRIKLHTSDKTISSAANFQRIFTSKYESEYLIIFHDDDTMHPQLIERELELMNMNSGLVWVGTSLRFVHDDFQMNQFKKIGKLENFSIYNSIDFVRLLLKNFHLPFNTVMYRTDILENMNVFYNKYNKWFDRPLLVYLSKKGKVGIIKEKLVNYRVHHGQDSQFKSRDDLFYLINLCNCYKDNLSMPLNCSDTRLFCVWSTNSLIKVLSDFSNNFNEYYELLKKYRKIGLIKLSCLNIRGVWYLLKLIKKYSLTK